MKKLTYLVVCLAAVTAFVACKNNNNTRRAGETAREYAENLRMGNYDAFVNNLIFDESNPRMVDRRDQRIFTELMRERHDPVVREKGGIKDIKVKSEKVTNDGNNANVVLTTTYNNGMTEDTPYDLIWVDNGWKINMDKHRQVWRTKTADGRDVKFTIKDYDNKDVIKRHVEGEDREFIKVKEDDNRTVVKIKDGDHREVHKVIDKGDEIVIKDKVDGEKEVTRIDKDEI